MHKYIYAIFSVYLITRVISDIDINSRQVGKEGISLDKILCPTGN